MVETSTCPIRLTCSIYPRMGRPLPQIERNKAWWAESDYLPCAQEWNMALWSCTSSSNNSRDQSHGRKVKLPQCGSRKQTEQKGKSDKASSGQSLGMIKVSLMISYKIEWAAHSGGSVFAMLGGIPAEAGWSFKWHRVEQVAAQGRDWSYMAGLSWPSQVWVHTSAKFSWDSWGMCEAKQGPAACETGNRYSLIFCIPISPPGLRTTAALAPGFCLSAWLVQSASSCWVEVRVREWKGSVSLRAPQGLRFSPRGQAGGKSQVQISIWSRGLTRPHGTAKAFQVFSGREFQPLFQISTHYILKAYFGNHIGF